MTNVNLTHEWENRQDSKKAFEELSIYGPWRQNSGLKRVKTGQRPSGDKNTALRVVCTRQKSFASPLGKNLQIASHLTGP